MFSRQRSRPRAPPAAASAQGVSCGDNGNWRWSGMAVSEAWRPDLVLVNGRVLTMDPADTVVEALAIKDDRILAVGSTSEIEGLAGSRTERIDLRGRTALPGLADIHVHL